MEKKIAQIISVITHPLLVPTYIYLILFSKPAFYTLSLTAQGHKTVVLIVFIITAITPLSIILLLFRNKSIKEKLMMEKRQERIFPLIVVAFFYYANYYVLSGIPLHPVFHVLNILFSVNIVITLIISFFWKISLHTISWGAFVGVLSVFTVLLQTPFLLYILVGILLSGIVATARLILKSHQNLEIYLGFLTGFLVSIFTYLLYFV